MKILVIRAGKVGDMVMITPALRAILNAYPNAEIHLLTSKEGQRTLRHFDSRVSKFLIHDRSSWFESILRILLRKTLAEQEYAKIFCFEFNPSFHKLVNNLCPDLRVIKLPNRSGHYAQHCLDTLTADELAKSNNKWVNLPVSQQALQKSSTVLNPILNDDTILIGIHPTFGGMKKGRLRPSKSVKRKMWPLEHFARLSQLIHQWAKAENLNIVVLADLLADESKIGETLKRLSNNRITIITPEPDFERYKATLQRMDLLVTPDTGPMHIAAAVGTPLVALFSERDPGECGPFTDPLKFSVIRAEDTPQPELGLAAIDPATVFETCKKMLSEKLNTSR